jgi:peptidase M48-like protein
MRLNLRLIGILHGILLLALIGEMLLRSMRYSRDSKKGGGAIVVGGLALFIIGYVGLFFGKLIKSAVSRQREYLADAAAVQFTRNPGGLSGALKRIGGLDSGSRITEANPEQASHLFFGNALRTSLFGLMSTHPPLGARIKRLEPSFDGRFPKAVQHVPTVADLHPLQSAMAPESSVVQAELVPLQVERFLESVGTPAEEHVAYAAELVSSLPAALVSALHQPVGAMGTIYAVLLSDDPTVQASQLAEIATYVSEGAADAVRRLRSLVEPLPLRAFLPLVEMAVPALNDLTVEQYQQLRAMVKRLIAADEKVSLFEYALERALLKHLSRQFDKPRAPLVKYYSMRPLLPACGQLLSHLAYASHRGIDAGIAQCGFSAAVERLRVDLDQVPMFPRQECQFSALDDALDRLAAATPQIKKRVLEACAASIAADGQVTVAEGELLRVFADSLDCPVPPLMPNGQSQRT